MKLSLFIVLLVLLSLPISAAPVSNEGSFVKFSLLNQAPDPARPGQIIEVSVGIQNSGSDTIQSLEVELVDSFPFSSRLGDKALKTYGNIPGRYFDDDQVIARWNVKVHEQAGEGNNDLRLRYRFGTNDEWIYVNVPILVRTGDVSLTIPSITTTPERISAGDAFDLNINLENPSNNPLHELEFRLELSDPLVTLNGTNEKYLARLGSMSSENISFSMLAKGDADGSVYTVPLHITWQDVEGNTYEKTVSFGVIIQEKPSLVFNIESSEVISKGDSGQVTIGVYNLGVQGIKFLNVELHESEDYKITSPAYTYLGNVDSDDYENANFDIYVKRGKDSIPLYATVTYQDSLNKQYVEEVRLDLPLYGKSEAARLGLRASGNPLITYIVFVILVFSVAFWLLMFIDLRKRRLPKNTKISWMIILVLTTLFGAVLYYFMVKRKVVR